MLQPHLRRTWAPRGDTPVHYSWDRHDRLSVITTVSTGALRRRMGLQFRVLDHNVRTEDMVAYLRALRRQLQCPVLLVWDRLGVHGAAVNHLRRRGAKWLEVEKLPPYAPDLNPVEYVWGHAKGVDLANYIPEDVDDLGRKVRGSLRSQRSRPHLIRSFFAAAGLPL